MNGLIFLALVTQALAEEPNIVLHIPREKLKPSEILVTETNFGKSPEGVPYQNEVSTQVSTATQINSLKHGLALQASSNGSVETRTQISTPQGIIFAKANSHFQTQTQIRLNEDGLGLDSSTPQVDTSAAVEGAYAPRKFFKRVTGGRRPVMERMMIRNPGSVPPKMVASINEGLKRSLSEEVEKKLAAALPVSIDAFQKSIFGPLKGINSWPEKFEVNEESDGVSLRFWVGSGTLGEPCPLESSESQLVLCLHASALNWALSSQADGKVLNMDAYTALVSEANKNNVPTNFSLAFAGKESVRVGFSDGTMTLVFRFVQVSAEAGNLLFSQEMPLTISARYDAAEPEEPSKPFQWSRREVTYSEDLGVLGTTEADLEFFRKGFPEILTIEDFLHLPLLKTFLSSKTLAPKRVQLKDGWIETLF